MANSIFNRIKNYRPGDPGQGPNFDYGGFGLDPGHDYGLRGPNQKQINRQRRQIRRMDDPADRREAKRSLKKSVRDARKPFTQSEIGRNWIEQNPDAYYQLALGQTGMPTDDQTAYGRWLSDQFGDLYGDFESARGKSPNLRFEQYLAGVTGKLRNQYRTSPYQMRGETPIVTGSASWIGGY